MPITDYAIIAAVSYLLGSIPFGYILVRTFTGKDVRAQGSGNIGATNVARTGKKGLAIATLVLDALKGYGAVWVAGRWAESHTPASFVGDDSLILNRIMVAMTTAALFAVIGHMYPVWLKFKGGKGVATALGVYVALAPKAIVVSIVVFFIVVALTRYVSLGSILAAIAFPFGYWFLHRHGSHMHAGGAVMLMICAIQVLIIWKHSDNIRRLLSGTESKFGGKKAGAA